MMHDKPNHNQTAEEINKPNFEFQFTTTKQIYFAFINKCVFFFRLRYTK